MCRFTKHLLKLSQWKSFIQENYIKNDSESEPKGKERERERAYKEMMIDGKSFGEDINGVYDPRNIPK